MHPRPGPRSVLIAAAAGLGIGLSVWTLMSLAGPTGRNSAGDPLDAAPAVSADPAEHACLALTLYWEAKNEGRNGMIAVAWVVLNRRSHPDFPKRICEVVRQGALFFHSTLLPSVPWHGQGRRTRTGQIGRHVYYR